MFEDTAHDFGDLNDDGNSDDTGGDVADEMTFPAGFNEDPITCGFDTRFPIWRPRQYFLRAFEARIQEPRREWDELVQQLVVDITEYVCSQNFDY